MPKYLVDVTFTGSYCYEVEAKSEDEAYEIATADTDVRKIDDWDVDIEVVEAFED